MTHVAYLVSEPEVSPLVVVPGWSLQQNVEDLMRDFHEGIGRDLLGSLLITYAVRVDVLEGNTSDERLNALALHLPAWANTSDLRCP